MKNRLYILLLVAFLACKPFAGDERTHYFPKAVIHAVTIPPKHRVWVFMLAGQSNMAGRGLVAAEDTLPSERILSITSRGELIYAKEPLHFYEPSRTGLDGGLSFGKELILHIPDSIAVLLIPTAVGGTSVSQWLNDSTHRTVRLLSNFKDKLAIGKLHGEIKGILWHQGEADANPQNIPFYKERLTALMARFRNITAQADLPILLGELGSFSLKNAYWQSINEQIRQVSAADKNTAVIHTQDLKGQQDHEHFNAKGQRQLGKRFATQFLQLNATQ